MVGEDTNHYQHKQMETPFWQKCPICDGKGTISLVSNFANTPCSVCNGAKIISNLTGEPPAAATQNTKKKTIAPLSPAFNDMHDKEN